jgi:hypothetical protein
LEDTFIMYNFRKVRLNSFFKSKEERKKNLYPEIMIYIFNFLMHSVIDNIINRYLFQLYNRLKNAIFPKFWDVDIFVWN